MERKLLDAAMSGDVKGLDEISTEFLSKEFGGRNTAAHLAAKFGHSEFLREIVTRSSCLLVMTNSSDDTPLHCAARLGKEQCVVALLDVWQSSLENTKETETHDATTNAESSITTSGQGLAVTDDDYQKAVPPLVARAGICSETESYGRDYAQVRHGWRRGGDLVYMLKMTNKHGNTALHEAVRGRNLQVFTMILGKEPSLASRVNTMCESPLYLASDMALLDFVRTLLKLEHISYEGPRGKTALHAAAFRFHEDPDVARILMISIAGLNVKCDDSGSTPLHYVVSRGCMGMTKLLLDKDASVALKCDNQGFSPVHVAAATGKVCIMKEIVRRRPDTALIVDNKGRNFLHLAVEHNEKGVISYVLKTPFLEELLNMQDNDGNTPLHLAVLTERRDILNMLQSDRRVANTITNKEGETPFDKVYRTAKYSSDFRKWKITSDLYFAGWKFSPQRLDLLPRNQMQKEAEEIKRSKALVQNMTITSVLVATVCFAAAFTLPGGYKPDGPGSGTAVSTRRAAFKVFLIADTLAMATAVIITFLLTRTGSWDHSVRAYSIRMSLRLLWIPVGSMVVAFATAVYMAVASRCLWLAVVVVVLSCSVPLAIYALRCYPLEYFGAIAIIKSLVLIASRRWRRKARNIYREQDATNSDNV